MTNRLLVKADGVVRIIQDLSESWSGSQWLGGGEYLQIRPPHTDQLRDDGYVYVTLTRRQARRLVRQVEITDIAKRYDARLIDFDY